MGDGHGRGEARVSMPEQRPDSGDLALTAHLPQAAVEDFRALADAAPVMLWATDPENRCVFISSEWSRFTGQSFEDALGFGWIDRIHPDDRKSSRETFENAARARKPFRLEYRVHHCDGVYRWAIDAGAPRFDADGTFLGYAGSVTDISVQKEAEAAARTGEERLHLALSAAKAGIWDWDLATDRLHWSPETYEVLGVPEQARPPTYRDFENSVHPDDRAQVYRVFRTFLDSIESEFRMEYRICHPRWGVRWVESLARTVRSLDGASSRVRGIILDITQRKRAEEETRAVAERLTSVLESTTDGVFVLDRQWRFTYLNQRARDLIGRGRELLNTNVWESFPEAVGSSFERTYRHAMETAEPAECEAYLPSLDTWYRANAFPTGSSLTVFFRDMTQERTSQEALRESEERFRQFADNSRDVIWIVDTQQRTIEYVSPAFEPIWGRSCTWVKEKAGRWLETIHPDDRAAVEELNRLLFEKGQQAFEYRIVRPDGAIRWIRDSTFTIRDERGTLRRIGGIAEDITERRESEQRLRLLAAEVDHRAKNMLAVVQVMLRQTRADSAKEYAAAALGRVAALARAHTLLSRTRWEGASMRQLVEEELLPHAGRHDDCTRIDGPDLALPPRTAQSFTMAMHELATNAAKHGALSVSGGCVEIAWSLSDDGIELHWRETGGPAVAEPQRRGLGMTVVEQSICQQLDGRVEFRWRPGGLDCTLRIPASALIRAAPKPLSETS